MSWSDLANELVHDIMEHLEEADATWSDLPNDLVHDIMDHLEVADAIRLEAVCVEWRSSIRREYYHRPNIPWLMLSSPRDDKMSSRYFYSLTEHKVYKFHLPEIAGQHCVGSSQGYLISVDDNADLIATNPLPGRARISLPPTSTLPDVCAVVRDESGRIIKYEVNKLDLSRPSTDSETFSVKHLYNYHYVKAILSPGAETAVVIHGNLQWLSFARIGDQSWTALEAPTIREFDDMIFRKGLLYAIDYMGTLAVFNLDCPSNPLLVSPWGPLSHEATDPRWYLVESPDGEKLFLVFKGYHATYDDILRPNNFKVYMLDETTYKWNQIKTLGDVALFLGFNYSMSLCTRGCPSIKRNCIYFTDDFKLGYVVEAGDKGVFNLEDGSIDQVCSDAILDQFDWPPPVWFMPTLS